MSGASSFFSIEDNKKKGGNSYDIDCSYGDNYPDQVIYI